MRIRAASDALGVPVPTLRRWTQEFAVGLSPEARASEGRPREFSPRDMRVLRRAKEILKDPDITYERARRTLSTEGLLTHDAGEGAASDGQPRDRDDAGDRQAAERFVRDVVERQVAQLREMVTGLVQRVGELEREVRELREAPARPPAPTGPAPVARPAASTTTTEGVQEIGDFDRRRGWPFR